jgi:hypothetical protein
MDVTKLAAVALFSTAMIAARPVQGQERTARIRVTVAVVAHPIPPAVTDSLAATAGKARGLRILPTGVRVVFDQSPAESWGTGGAQSSAVAPTRRVVIEYIGT